MLRCVALQLKLDPSADAARERAGTVLLIKLFDVGVRRVWVWPDAASPSILL